MRLKCRSTFKRQLGGGLVVYHHNHGLVCGVGNTTFSVLIVLELIFLFFKYDDHSAHPGMNMNNDLCCGGGLILFLFFSFQSKSKNRTNT